MEIRHFLRIRVLPDKVYGALTTPEGMKEWWTNCTRSDGSWHFDFGKYGKMSMKIVSEGKDRVVWEYLEGSMEDGPWKETRIVFSMEQEGDDTTMMRFSHAGWKEDVSPGILDNINYNWGRFMFSLKTYVETGKGFPIEFR